MIVFLERNIGLFFFFPNNYNYIKYRNEFDVIFVSGLLYARAPTFGVLRVYVPYPVDTVVVNPTFIICN